MLFSSESVTEGHPDKVADQISDALLDAALEQDPAARVACETLVTGNLAVLAGEVTTSATLDAEQIARSTIAAIGYTRPDLGFNAGSARIEVVLQRQSPDIARGVDVGGAGDQGMMFGYACRETPELMPLPIRLAHRLTERLSWLRRNGALPWLLPDGKTQVSVEYDQNHDPVRVATVIVSAHHEAGASSAEIEEGIRELCVAPVLEGLDTSRLRLFVNPTGRFTVGGPAGDTGVTGRKIIVDTYGSAAPHGGGCFRAKTPRRWIARQRTRHVGWPRTSWLLDLRAVVRCNSRTRSGFRSRWRYGSTPRVPACFRMGRSPGSSMRCLT